MCYPCGSGFAEARILIRQVLRGAVGIGPYVFCLPRPRPLRASKHANSVDSQLGLQPVKQPTHCTIFIMYQVSWDGVATGHTTPLILLCCNSKGRRLNAPPHHPKPSCNTQHVLSGLERSGIGCTTPLSLRNKETAKERWTL